MKKAKRNNLIICLAFIGICLAMCCAGAYYTDRTIQKVADLSADNAKMHLAENRLLRARSNHLLPGMTQEDMDRLSHVAHAYGLPPELLYGIRRQENGGEMLEVGANTVTAFIKQSFPVEEWQYAMACTVLSQEIWKAAMADRELGSKIMMRVGKRWNMNSLSWTAAVLSFADEARLTSGKLPSLAMPKVVKAPYKGKKGGNRSHKAKGKASHPHDRR